MRKIIAFIVLQILYYLLWAFISWDFSYLSDIRYLRFVYAVGDIFLSWLLITIIIQHDPKFLKTKTHEEKKQWLKKYIWELHEELSLCKEADDVLKKVQEYKRSRNS